MQKAVNELKDFFMKEKLASELDRIKYSEETVAPRRTRATKNNNNKNLRWNCVLEPELELR